MSPDAMLTIIKIAAVFIVVSFVVFWVGLVWWVSQDILTRTRDKIIVSAAVAITAILGPVGILIYLVVRPRQTLKERVGELMEQEMMLQASAITICPTCERVAQDNFLACPHCGTTLKKACIECGKLLAMDWEHCPYCGANQQPATIEVAEVVIEQIAQPVEPDAAQVPAVSTEPIKARRKPIVRPMIDTLRTMFTPITPMGMPTTNDELDKNSATEEAESAKSKVTPRKKIKSSKSSTRRGKSSAKKH
jgi:RNA polymerase subunit RPABC4/transcription elongation factor Spt4